MDGSPFFDIPLPRVCTVVDVPVAHFPIVWPKIQHWVWQGVELGGGAERYRIEDVLQLLVEGRAKLWIAYVEGEFKAAMCTELLTYPRCKECRIWFVAGIDMESCIPVSSDMHCRTSV